MFRKLLYSTLLGPTLLGYFGAFLNQLVLIANGGKFPVMLNPRWSTQMIPDASGMIDDVHCVMTGATRLNFLADIFNFHTSIMSVGDLLLNTGSTLQPYCFGAFLLLVGALAYREWDGA